MTTDLQRRLEEHRLKLRKQQAFARLQTFLAQFDAIDVIRFEHDVGNEAAIDTAWRDMVAISAQPISTLPLAAAAKERVAWLDDGLQQAGIREACYIKIIEINLTPWTEIRIPASSTWLVDLWQVPDAQEFLILRADKKLLLYVSEEEYDYHLYVRKLASFLLHAS